MEDIAVWLHPAVDGQRLSEVVFFYSSALPAIPLGFTIFGEICAYVTVFSSNARGCHIPSSWIVHAGCVFCCRHLPVQDMKVRIF